MADVCGKCGAAVVRSGWLWVDPQIEDLTANAVCGDGALHDVDGEPVALDEAVNG